MSTIYAWLKSVATFIIFGLKSNSMFAPFINTTKHLNKRKKEDGSSSSQSFSTTSPSTTKNPSGKPVNPSGKRREDDSSGKPLNDATSEKPLNVSAKLPNDNSEKPLNIERPLTASEKPLDTTKHSKPQPQPLLLYRDSGGSLLSPKGANIGGGIGGGLFASMFRPKITAAAYTMSGKEGDTTNEARDLQVPPVPPVPSVPSAPSTAAPDPKALAALNAVVENAAPTDDLSSQLATGLSLRQDTIENRNDEMIIVETSDGIAHQQIGSNSSAKDFMSI
jgi:hypothetical protein